MFWTAPSRNAVPLVEPGCLLGDCHFFGCLFNHLLNTRELEFLIYKASYPYGAQLRRRKV
ncbi:hypothetical protein CFP56_040325 [Quercus suber]|uniref:Uncharacterized protein n=1 Tax=Quercus suber TaxID=58331 RepID=A0AAW0LMD6_QUESU